MVTTKDDKLEKIFLPCVISHKSEVTSTAVFVNLQDNKKRQNQIMKDSNCKRKPLFVHHQTDEKISDNKIDFLYSCLFAPRNRSHKHLLKLNETFCT